MSIRTMLKKRILYLLVISAGIILCIYPSVSNYVFNHRVDSLVDKYREGIDKEGEEKRRQHILAAREYNSKNHPSSMEYEDLLNINGDGIMGILTIPSIEIKVPIYHGSSEEVLKKGIGHLPASSLPVGGKGTHAVLTGHTGMNTARLFSDLINVKEGDFFLIEVCGEKLAYKVIRIYTVLPSETSLLEAVKGKDYVTLVTCTPYGVNSHRLLVRGERTDEYTWQEKHSLKDDNGLELHQWEKEYIKALVAGAGIVIVLTIAVLIYKRYKKGKV